MRSQSKARSIGVQPELGTFIWRSLSYLAEGLSHHFCTVIYRQTTISQEIRHDTNRPERFHKQFALLGQGQVLLSDILVSEGHEDRSNFNIG